MKKFCIGLDHNIFAFEAGDVLLPSFRPRESLIER
jgi:hypothetical protein